MPQNNSRFIILDTLAGTESHEDDLTCHCGIQGSHTQVFVLVGEPIVAAALHGFNGTIFAYGQTGSGKTYTMSGGPQHYSERGIIPRALSQLFSQLESGKWAEWQVSPPVHNWLCFTEPYYVPPQGRPHSSPRSCQLFLCGKAERGGGASQRKGAAS